MGARIVTLTDNGELRLAEDSANGSDYVGHKAAASVTAQYDVTWPGAPPGSDLFMKMNASGIVSFAAGASGTLDDAYDSGGAGGGRVITTDTGPVEAAGAGGFLASHSAPVIGLETTGAERNYRLTAGQTAGIFEIQVGDADGDISDDTFTSFFSLDGANRKVTLSSPIGTDISVVFEENATARWEIGYDDSAGGLVVGRLSFTNPVLFFEDTSGEIGIGTLSPNAALHIVQADAAIGLAVAGGAATAFNVSQANNFNGVSIAKTGTGSGTGLFAQNTGTGRCADFDNNGSGGNVLRCTQGASGATHCALLVCNAPRTTLFLDENGNGIALDIDSEATSQPLINLQPLVGNSRGDIAFSTARTSDASSPSEGDMWYNSTTKIPKFRDSTKTLVIGTNTFVTVADPGNGNTITPPVNCNFICTFTNSTGSQTRVLGAPAFEGQRATLQAAFSGGGTDTAITQPGTRGWLGGGVADDVATFNTTAQAMHIVNVGGDWRADYADSGITFT